ncbi:hypothetical protein SAMN06273570_1341 [Candidatus Pantoea floridensis]|uniref:Uncharacterized protein n=1 Tax=Candidatus Pantoea floridensis TaxID=1938870 RepID=A0A286BS85_9GAMM|nr:hypothetical protein BX596_3018 [Enterobacteriaceae bacterium JKS000233]SOD37017.1 hypothetical protein SAMN06273570_1341 [Pantoea floridensis]
MTWQKSQDLDAKRFDLWVRLLYNLATPRYSIGFLSQELDVIR